MKVLTGNSRLQQQAVKRRLGDTNTTAVHSVLKFDKNISKIKNFAREFKKTKYIFLSIIQYLYLEKDEVVVKIEKSDFLFVKAVKTSSDFYFLMRPFLSFFSIIADIVVEYIVILVATISWFQPPRQNLCVFVIIVTHNCWTRWQPKIKVLSFSTFIFSPTCCFYISIIILYTLNIEKGQLKRFFFLLFVNSYVHALSRSETRVLIFFHQRRIQKDFRIIS